MRSMLRQSMRVLATVALMSSSLLAAGQPALAQQKQKQDDTPPYYNWNGFYAGANLGGAWGSSDVLSIIPSGVPFFEGQFYPGADNSAVAGIIAAYRSNTLDVRSVTGGFQAGYNYWTGGFLLGVEADIDFLNAHKSKTTSALGSATLTPALGPALYTFRNEIDANYVATLRGRIGAPVGTAIVYATGGLALTTLKYEHEFRGTGGFFTGGPDITEHASVSETKVGWALGGGVELPLAQNISLKAEYIATVFGDVTSNHNKINPLDASLNPPDFACGTPDTKLGTGGVGAKNVFPVPNPTPRQCFDHKADLFLQSIRLGLNFKF